MKAPRVTLDQWRTLQAVVDHGGFAQAAEALHRSQSSISYTVARMQEQLGVPLLRIDGRKAVLTEAGEVLLRRSRQLVKQAGQLEELAHHMEQGWEPEVRLVVDAAYPTARIVRSLSAFMPQSRGCRVLLREEVLSGVEEALIQGAADLAISGLIIPGHLGADLSVVEFVAVAHPDHPLHRLQRELTHQDLETQMQVVIRDSGRLQPRDHGWLGAEQRWTVGSLATAATFVGNGLGFAWLPRHIIERELQSGQLKPLPLSQGVRQSRSTSTPTRRSRSARPARSSWKCSSRSPTYRSTHPSRRPNRPPSERRCLTSSTATAPSSTTTIPDPPSARRSCCCTVWVRAPATGNTSCRPCWAATACWSRTAATAAPASARRLQHGRLRR